jgi:hypothetical protein
MRIRTVLFGLALLLLATPAAAATITPSVGIVVDGVLVGTIDAVNDTESGGWIIDQYEWGKPDSDPNTPEAPAHITINAVLDPDPSIIYAMSVIDFGAASTFGFIFIQPIVATAAPGVASHTESSSTTGGGGSTAPVTALAPPGGIPVDGDAVTEQFVYTLSQDGGATYLNVGLDIRPSFPGAAPSDTQAAINLGPVAGPAGAGSYNVMRVDVNFSMAGGNDAYTFNGEATIDVPEPSVAALLALSLGALAVGARRRF